MSASDRTKDRSGHKRLMTRREAASYCAVSTTTFDRICEVTPVALVKNNPRLHRFDIRDIDAWIQSRKDLNDNVRETKDDLIDLLLQ